MKWMPLAALATLAAAAPALAEPSGAGACRKDAAAFCAKLPSGPERVRCLEAHAAALSPECKAHLEEMHSRGEAFRADCRAEIGASCLNLQGRALVECLETQGGKLSKPCADRLAALREARRAVHETIPAACKDDAQRLCSGAASGAIGSCLRAAGDKASRECREALK